jgi:heme exporter protein B
VTAPGRGAPPTRSLDRSPPGPWLALLARELRLALRHPADTLAAVLFFVLVAALFPFGVGPAPETLARLAPGALLAAALLAALLPLDRLFGADAEDGTLDQLLLSGLAPSAVALAKAVAHWLTTGLPLLLATPIAAAMLNLPVEAWGAAMAALGLAAGFLSLLGTAGAALTLGARRGGVLLPLLVLPLAIPAVIFGAAGIEAAAAGLEARPYLLLLAALLAAALPLAPLAAGAALRVE